MVVLKHGIEMRMHWFENHGFCVVDIVMVWLCIKDDLSSGKYYSAIIWIMKNIVNKHGVTFRYISYVGPWVLG